MRRPPSLHKEHFQMTFSTGKNDKKNSTNIHPVHLYGVVRLAEKQR